MKPQTININNLNEKNILNWIERNPIERVVISEIDKNG